MKQRNIKIGITVAIVAILSLWVKSRWHAWFVSLPETEYTTASKPDRITLLPGEDFATERIISWRTGTEPRNAYVWLASESNTVTVSATSTVVENTVGRDAFYRAKLSGLQPGESYSYKVVVEGCEPSESYEFQMPDGENLQKIIYIGDVQDTIGGIAGDIMRGIRANHPDAQAVIFGGDLIEGPIDKFWSYSFTAIDTLAHEIPIIAVAGNHEYRKSLVPYLDHRWKHTFAYDDNGASGVDASYFIQAPNALIVVLDSQIFMRGYTILSQYNWLKDVVENYGDSRHKILVLHHPPYSVKPKRNNVVEKKLFAPLADKLGFDAVLAGHEHGYYRRLGLPAGAPLYIVSHCSPKGYPAVESDSSQLVIPNRRMYQVLEFDGDSISTFGMRYRAYDAITHQLLDEYQN
ncbi:MAG: metallophosphoesterase family protein [Muribaculaceae bacterium]|nr:metallophosphoesterase family protein [Muribaculaceae bacterium]